MPKRSTSRSLSNSDGGDGHGELPAQAEEARGVLNPLVPINPAA